MFPPRFIAYLTLALTLTSCARSGGLSGKYTPSGPASYQSLTFKAGGKVDIAFARDTTGEGSYVIDGTSVKVTTKAKTDVFALDANGCLDGGTVLGKYCKNGGKPAPSAPITNLSPQPLASEPVVPNTLDHNSTTGGGTAASSPQPPTASAANSKLLAPSPMLGSYVATKGKGVSLTLEFLDARNVRMTVTGGGPTAAQDGTYKIDGDHISVTIQGDTAEFSRIDNGLEGKLDNEVVKFTKK